ncbi:atrial natriuretic peptide receptor 1-like [Paramacrobiotus metropolitanus]|uniref:atrial natriuretic peptide receptor 1-like n=1 Tax=Paramacrobiotus metropolitanus TaxID=2943436 RepID=UPI0024458BF8|nr:atrial natriuretic peptide receptor 1-like [Paramacrobiotus metropolitanus]XP_055358013.1 atrial natriuretic peptide receptor 1-like [Paramacrobiotus metropolitanus]XP_055358014.1 atrial natriuretic peptide receptor 1-like [Paramacrobiotus metropolitanus]XP_055358015.1 atrial natriuretic peptide receptor 1-like [Paramacrobiotus metropolitanus]
MTCLALLIVILFYCLPLVSPWRVLNATHLSITIGVMRAESPSRDPLSAYDWRYGQPSIELAAARITTLYNVTPTFQYRNHGPCNSTDYHVAARLSEELLTAQTVDVLLASPCPAEFLLQASLTTSVPIFAPFAPLAMRVRQFDNVARFSYTTQTQWGIFFALCEKYNWTYVATIYDTTQDSYVSINTDFTAIARSYHSLDMFTVRIEDRANYTMVVSELTHRTRVAVLIANLTEVRKIMLAAYAQQMCNGEYAFFYFDTSLQGTPIPESTWRNEQDTDDDARIAFRALQILAINFTNEMTAYNEFFTAFARQAQTSLGMTFKDTSYLMLSDYNAIIAAGAALRRAYTVNGTSVNLIRDFLKASVWNTTFQDGALRPFTIGSKGEYIEHFLMYDMDNTTAAQWQQVCNYDGFSQQLSCTTEPEWPGPVAPSNVPKCGFDGSLCDDSGSGSNLSVIGAAVGSAVGGALLIAGIAYCCFAQAHIERKVRHSWIARWNDLTLPSPDSIRESSAKKEAIKFLNAECATEKDRADVRDVQAQDTALYGHIQPYGIYWNRKLFMGRLSKKYRLHLTRRLVNEINTATTLRHENVALFEGACLDPDHVMIIYEYCSKGSLSEMLLDVLHKVDWTIRYSLLHDIVKGLAYIQQSPLGCHGRLTSHCCFIDMRFGLKIADCGLDSFFELSVAEMWAAKRDSSFYARMLWMAPERLRSDYSVHGNSRAPSKASDIYSFGIILQETVLRMPPFGMFGAMSAEEIVDELKRPAPSGDESYVAFRPTLTEEHADSTLVELAHRCWTQSPADRPSILQVKVMMKDLGKHLGFGEKGSILDTLLDQMEELMTNLQQIIEERSQTLLEQKTQSDELLGDIIPKVVAERLKRAEKILPETFESCTIMLVAIDNFARITADSTALQITEFLLDFHHFLEEHVARQGCLKVDFHDNVGTIVSGAPIRNGHIHGEQVVKAALGMLYTSLQFKIRHRPNEVLRITSGINSGPCVGGVVGHVLLRYCLFGETAQICTRMLETAEEMTVRCSAMTKELLSEHFELQENGEVFVKGKGVIVCFIVRDVLEDTELAPLEEQFHYDMMAYRARRLADSRKGGMGRIKGRSLTTRM